ARDLLNLHPGHPKLEPEDAQALPRISDDILALYQAARAPVRFRPEDVQPDSRDRAEHLGAGRRALAVAKATDPAARSLGSDDDSLAEGSNNWVISGTRTFSRGTILANDPHRALLVPSLRYWVHLVAPGWNVVGAGEPALPGVSIGHNEVGAWGFTIFPVDQEDLYVYETDPTNPSRYRYRGAWEEMRTIRETIAVKQRDPVAVDLKFTRHGPVLFADPSHHRAYALRAAWLEEGAAPYLASLRLDQATSWAEFRAAC